MQHSFEKVNNRSHSSVLSKKLGSIVRMLWISIIVDIPANFLLPDPVEA
jgi:hypothetical protein